MWGLRVSFEDLGSPVRLSCRAGTDHKAEELGFLPRAEGSI